MGQRMKKRLFVTASILALASNGALASDDRLAAALKKIADLEAKNKSLTEEVKSLRGEKPRREAKKGQSLTSNEPSLSQPKQYTSLDVTAPQASSALVGFYAGVNGGYGGGDYDYGLNSIEISGGSVRNYAYGNGTTRFSGALVGGQIGYNYISSSKILLGGEFDFDWSNIANTGNSTSTIFLYGAGDGYSTTNGSSKYGPTWLSTVRGRMGYSYGPVLPYVTAGFAFGEVLDQASSSIAQNSSYFRQASLANDRYSQIKTGYTVGAGLEYTILPNISVKTEYLYNNIGSPSGNKIQFGYPYSINTIASANIGSLSIHQVRFGINYHPHFFDTPSITAKY